MIELVGPDRIGDADVDGWHGCRVAAGVVDLPGRPPGGGRSGAGRVRVRGRGFGPRVGAAMIVWLWAECPEITEYETGNADVNERLGYRPVDTLVEWRRTVAV